MLTKKQAKEGVERIRSEAKSFVEKLRSQQNTEEAYRITGIVKELTEGIEEGWKQTGLDAWISYFNKETVSFLDYFDPELLYPVREILAKAQRKDTVYLTGLEQKLPGMTTEARFSFDVRNMNSYQNSFEMLIKDLTGWKKERYRVILLSGCGHHRRRYVRQGEEKAQTQEDLLRGQEDPELYRAVGGRLCGA